LKKSDDIHVDSQTDVNHLFYKLRWLQASSGAKDRWTDQQSREVLQ